MLVNGSDFYCGNSSGSPCQFALKNQIPSQYVHPSTKQCSWTPDSSTIKNAAGIIYGTRIGKGSPNYVYNDSTTWPHITLDRPIIAIAIGFDFYYGGATRWAMRGCTGMGGYYNSRNGLRRIAWSSDYKTLYWDLSSDEDADKLNQVYWYLAFVE